tara:strand:+ start:70 stop:330 length:261 start_codon:yes stop_codon:yes gene_type:complete
LPALAAVGYSLIAVITYTCSIAEAVVYVDFGLAHYRRWLAGLIAKYYWHRMEMGVSVHSDWVAMMLNDKSKLLDGHGFLVYTVVDY